MSFQECLFECLRWSIVFKRRYEISKNADGSYFPKYVKQYN